MKNGLIEENGELIYYKDDVPYHAGLIEDNGDIYYIGSGGCAVKGTHTVHTSMTNGLLKRGVYQFGEDYKLIRIDESKNGLFEENGNLIYYKNGRPNHAGIIKEGNDIYYIGSGGYAVKGTHNVHSEMTNGIVKRGTYTFGEDYKLDPKSYIVPKKSKKKHKSKKKLSSKDKKLILILASVIVVVLLFGVGLIAINKIIDNQKYKDQTYNPTSAQKIVLPTFDKDVLLCSEAVKKAYDGEITVQQAISAGNPYRPFVFEYTLVDKDGILKISEKADMSDAGEYILSRKEKSVSIDNLKTGTTYYYKVTVGEDIYSGSFHTAESTRFISLPGVYNTRDIGGYITIDGKMVRQGILIRGTEIDGLGEVNQGDSYFLKDRESVQPFGFVFDMDLRYEVEFWDNYKSRLGDNVTHKQYKSSCYYKDVFTKEGKQTIKEIFTDLSNPSNYPIYLHCTYGADRTGTVSFLIEGLLGISEKQMLDDYMLTGLFQKGFDNNSKINGILGGLEEYKGDTVNERIENYILSTGVTMEQIESIRNIFLE